MGVLMNFRFNAHKKISINFQNKYSNYMYRCVQKLRLMFSLCTYNSMVITNHVGDITQVLLLQGSIGHVHSCVNITLDVCC